MILQLYQVDRLLVVRGGGGGGGGRLGLRRKARHLDAILVEARGKTVSCSPGGPGPRADEQTDRQTERQTGRQAGRQTARQGT
eukprot:SAG22_NODE_188_length_15821_cov_38.313319_30_plen_83_part_00